MEGRSRPCGPARDVRRGGRKSHRVWRDWALPGASLGARMARGEAMVITLFGPFAALFGVPVAAWYAGRGFGSGAWFGGVVCLTFSCLTVCIIPVPGPVGFHVPCPQCSAIMAGYVAWSAPWALWARRRLRRVRAKDTVATGTGITA